jgi:hypothetical protein
MAYGIFEFGYGSLRKLLLNVAFNMLSFVYLESPFGVR